jgi:hypothetical protein
LPSDWGATLGSVFRGRVRYRRRFNRPTGLDAHERVWLVVEGADPRAGVRVNDDDLGDIQGYALVGEFDVTGLLKATNELTLEVELTDAEVNGLAILRPGREHKPGGPIGEVRLEVRSTAFISELAVWMEEGQGGPRLHVAGRIGGESQGSSLAVVVGGRERELLYGEVRAGQPFELSDLVADLPLWLPTSAQDELLALEIKLVAGAASAWQSVRRTSYARVAWEPRTGRLTFGDSHVGLPLAVFDPPVRDIDERRLRGWLASNVDGSNAGLGLREVLPATSYDAFDALGCPLVQFVPLGWAEVVCPGLVHHPSIVAWAAPAGELAQTGPDRLARSALGRPWLASEKVLDGGTI